MIAVVVLILVFYAVCAVGVFAMEASSGPVTRGLALVRGLTWPRYIITGKPYGVRAQMD